MRFFTKAILLVSGTVFPLLGAAQISPPTLIGHRGMLKNAPENTLAAFDFCVQRGIGIEIDVRTSRDGELVIIHDSTFSRTTNGPPAGIHELTLAEIKKLDAGSWFNPSFSREKVPTLEETFRLVRRKQKKRVPVAINIKAITEEGEQQLVALLEKYKLWNQAFCFDQTQECSERLKALDSRVRIGSNVRDSQFQQRLAENFLDVFLLLFIPNSEQLDQLRVAGKKGIYNFGGPGTDRDNPRAWDHLRDAGMDGILLDHSLEFYNYWSPSSSPNTP